MFVYVGKLNWFDYAVNEMITVVVTGNFEIGSHICAYWQWTKAANGIENENVIYDGIIDKSDFVNGSGVIGFCCDSANPRLTCYRFDGKVNIEEKTMKLMITSKSKGKMSFKLGEVYEEYPMDKEVKTVKLYTGKLNWYEHAVNEMITVVMPAGCGKRAPISAYWQWTKAANGIEKNNMVFSGIIDSVYFSSRFTTIRFRSIFTNSEFAWQRFEATISEGESIMDVTLRSRSDGESFIALGLSYAGTQSGGKRSLNHKTSTIVNDSDEAYLCELQASDTTERSRNLASIGLTISVVPATLNPRTVSWTIPNILGGAFTIGGILTEKQGAANEWTESDKVAKLLFPGESISRTTGLPVPFRTNNALRITKLSLEKRSEESSNLIIGIGIKTGLIQETYQLKDILKEINFDKFFQFTLQIPGPSYMQMCTLIKIPGLKPCQSEGFKVSAALQALDQLPCGYIYTIEAGTGNEIMSYGPFRNICTFDINATSDLLFLEASCHESCCSGFKIIRMKLPNSDRVLLKMENYSFCGNWEEVQEFPNCEYEDDALALIEEKWAKDGDYFAFRWDLSGEMLGYKKPISGQLQKGSVEGTTMYMIVPWKAMYSRIFKSEHDH